MIVRMHHFGMATNDLERSIKTYEAHGYELAIPIEKGTVVKRYAYVKDLAGNYIELLESTADMPAA